MKRNNKPSSPSRKKDSLVGVVFAALIKDDGAEEPRRVIESTSEMVLQDAYKLVNQMVNKPKKGVTLVSYLIIPLPTDPQEAMAAAVRTVSMLKKSFSLQENEQTS